MFHILYPNDMVNEGQEKDDSDEPSFFMDLNLDQILDAILNTRKSYDIRKYYYKIPKNEETIQYRQQILKDLEDESLFQAFILFSSQLQTAREYLMKRQKSEIQIQNNRWLLDENYNYLTAVSQLSQSLSKTMLQSDGLQKLNQLLTSLKQSKQFQQLYEDTIHLYEQFSAMRVQFTISRDKLKMIAQADSTDYCERFQRLFPDKAHKEHNFIENPFQYHDELSHFEQIALELYKSMNKELFEELSNYCVTNQDIMESWVLTLEQEVQFYLSFLLFEEKYEKEEHHFCYPSVHDKQEFEVRNGFDLALLMKNLYHEVPVIENDLQYNEKERFMVVTGPNQGGKTTYARSIGQIVYFSLMGLKTPCSYASIPMFHGIMTHFSVEESLETGRGKLKEELIRLAPMMEKQSEKNFVIINELFTTAASYDAYIMGKRVLDHFIQMQCYGIYVTHIQELANETKEIVSLVAQVDESDYHKRTYKMIRKPSEGIGYANGLVEKYHLTYEELKGRLQNEGISALSRS